MWSWTETDVVWRCSADPRVRFLRGTIQQSTYIAGTHRQLLFSQAVRRGGGAGGVQPGGGRHRSGRCACASSAAGNLHCTAVTQPATAATSTSTWLDVTWRQQTRTHWRRVIPGFRANTTCCIRCRTVKE